MGVEKGVNCYVNIECALSEILVVTEQQRSE